MIGPLSLEWLLAPFSTVVADPPWPYDTSIKGTAALPHTVKKDGSIARGVDDMGYGVMTMADLKAMPVEGLMADNAHCYLWTTNAFMEQAHQLMRAWGFAPKTILTWTKTHQGDPSRVSMKTGYYFRGATEHVLFGVRGSLKLQVSRGVPTGFLWPRIGQHSVKPEAFFDLVEEVSPGCYLELFARRQRPGWTTWGNDEAVAV